MNKLSGSQILTLLLPVQILLVKFLSYNPEFIERYYSNGIYPWISRIFRGVFGWIPFSMGDLYYMGLIILLLTGVISLIKNRFSNLKTRGFRFGAYLSVFYFLFHFLWGMNYHRSSLYTSFQIEEADYSLEELQSLSRHLLKKIKITQLQLVSNDSLKVVNPHSKKEILAYTSEAYKTLALIYPQYGYSQRSIKASLFSLPLTYMGFAGYFNPLSGEAQVDVLVPKVSLPMISSHEVAHQLGIASESEANFIGYLAATHANDKFYNYSGYLTALRYSLGAMYYKDSLASQRMIDSIPKGIIKNIEESQEFWMSYQNKMEPFFRLFYDNYLRANQQDEGMRSYSRMINLLVAYEKKYPL